MSDDTLIPDPPSEAAMRYEQAVRSIRDDELSRAFVLLRYEVHARLERYVDRRLTTPYAVIELSSGQTRWVIGVARAAGPSSAVKYLIHRDGRLTVGDVTTPALINLLRAFREEFPGA